MKVPYNYIVVEGSIGAGKTTLATMLARDFNAQLVLERFADNPFLEKFYKDPEHYALPVEMSFLMDRHQQLKSLLPSRDLFSDFIIGDYFIDKCLLFSKNNLAADEFALFRTVFDAVAGPLPKPDLILYLYTTPDRLLRQIARRGQCRRADCSEHGDRHTCYEQHTDGSTFHIAASFESRRLLCAGCAQILSV